MTKDEQKVFDLMLEVLEGVEHFSDAVDYHNDPLSRAMSRWIDEGRIAIAKAKDIISRKGE